MLLLCVFVVACTGEMAVPPSTQTATAVARIIHITATPQTIFPTTTATATHTAIPTALPTITVISTPAPTMTTTPLPTETPTTRMRDIVYIAGGLFPMGGDAATLLEECQLFRRGCQRSWFAPSQPQHTVLLHPFYIDRYEVTNQAFVTFLNTLKTHELTCARHDCINLSDSRIEWDSARGEYDAASGILDYPVTGISWYGAASFCAWRGARLPTEAEWEMAASWNPDDKVKTLYPWGDIFVAEAVNFCDAKCQETQADGATDDGFILDAPVGFYEGGRSPVGVYDMAGNVWEWVNDWYATDYYQQSPTVDPMGPDIGEERVVRGGSWFDTGNFTSSLIRFPAPPEESSNTIGFRCAWDD